MSHKSGASDNSNEQQSGDMPTQSSASTPDLMEQLTMLRAQLAIAQKEQERGSRVDAQLAEARAQALLVEEKTMAAQQLERALEQSAKRLSAFEAELIDTRARLFHAQEETIRAQQQGARAAAELAQAQAELFNATRALDSLHQSMSWRITRPMRAVTSMFRALKRLRS